MVALVSDHSRNADDGLNRIAGVPLEVIVRGQASEPPAVA